MSHFLGISELAERMAAGEQVRLLDIRWRLDRPDGRADYLAQHLPGAIFVDLDTELATHGTAQDGRHPAPTAATLQAAVRRWGVQPGDLIVAYDDARGLPAAWTWWWMRQYGIEVRVLDGGLRAWLDAGHPSEAGNVDVEPSTISIQRVRTDTLSIDEAAEFPERGILLDVRAAERYRGETEPLDPVAGHIPGAINLPFTWYFDGGAIRDVAELRAGFAQASIDGNMPVAAYCGSGITASHTALALAEAGIDAKIYPGSWSQWSNTPGRPVATGETP